MLMVLLFSVAISAKNYLPPPESEIISIALFIVVFLISSYIAHLITLAKARVVLTSEGIKHIWERRFIFSYEKNFIIPWDLVDNYVFHQDRAFDSFTINLTNKRRYKVTRLSVLPIKDDFYNLVNDFPKLADEYRNSGSSTGKEKQLIKHGESIYSGMVFKVSFFIMVAILLILVIMKIFNPDSQMNWTAIGVLGFAVLFYGTMMMQEKRQN